ncbi:MAG: CsgG/HfaB family protein [Treponema sp.]|nr:CsgG/HfaB family protein [Treponema sp.]
MKNLKTGRIFVGIILSMFLASCISLQDRPMTSKDLDELTVLGSIETNFLSWQPLHIHITPLIRYRAYQNLLEIARREYAGSYDTRLLDVKNITMEGTLSALQFDPFTTLGWYVNDWQRVSVRGDVVINSTALRREVTASSKGIEGAIYRSAEQFANELPNKAVVAILNISTTNEDAEFIIEELEHYLSTMGASFALVDRRGLEAIRQEQNFQVSGEVSDSSAVSIGNMLGATVVITGSTSGSANNRRLRLRALDVETSRIVSSSNEQY